MGFELGQKAGGYEFLAILETSGTGLTYNVRNLLAQRPEVLKVLPKDLQQDRERVERFLREAKIQARLQHANIASFYSAMEIEGQLVLTTELVEGVTLEQRLEQGPLPWEEAVDYALQALAALKYAHQEGVVHRDLTPAHLVITAQGSVKVTGFALAKQASDPQLTQPGMVMGSVYYMSPEQVKGSTTVDARSDIYSLGIVLYEAVTGKKPFDSTTQFEVFMAHVNTPPPAPREVHPDVPSDLSWVITTALAKDPMERFQSAQQFADALRRMKPAVGQSALQEGPETVSASPAPEGLASVEPAGRTPPGTPPWAPPASARISEPATASAVSASAISTTEYAEAPPAELGDALPGGPGESPAAAFEPVTTDSMARLSAAQSADSAPALPARPLAATDPAEPQGASWVREEAFPGWRSRDLVAVGTLTLVVIAAVFFTLLMLVNR